ncbi:polyhydroxyalkanoate synthesis repressor PhaR [Rhodobacteraceae bacterium NNCM2]|nr:polyhydroxyalkanoate synthesis repressor PhaR [Coraliihabitans acroporae]
MAEAKKSEKTTDGPIIIKKYANRRLYNTAKSSYVTLDDLSQMVRAGQDFAVFDAKSGDDITRSVLTQIIVEEEAKDQNMLPANFLRELIKLYGDPLQGVVPSYLDASMQAFAKNQDQMRSAFTSGNPMQGFEAMTRQNMEWFDQAMRMFSPFTPGGAKADEPAKEASGDVSEDLESLQKQLSEMQEQLAKLTKGS